MKFRPGTAQVGGLFKAKAQATAVKKTCVIEGFLVLLTKCGPYKICAAGMKTPD